MIRVVIPFGGDDPHRLRSLEWVIAHLHEALPDASVSIGRCDGIWSKAAAVADAIDDDWDDDDVLVVHDGDVWIPKLPDALEQADRHPWVMPHRVVHRMNEHLSDLALAGEVPFTGLGRRNWDQAPYLGVVGGGCAAMPLGSYRLCPLDPRFEGWGQEDEAWGVALTLMLGRPMRGAHHLYHFWHPHPPRKSRHVGTDEGLQLRTRYRMAYMDKPRMESILAEFRPDPRATGR